MSKDLRSAILEEAEKMASEPDTTADTGDTADDTQVSTPADNAPEKVSTPEDESAPKEPEAQPATAAKQLEAPKHWDAADRDEFNKMPPAAQQWALKRDKQIEATITKKTQEVAEQRKAVEPLLAAQQEHMPYLQSIGVTPDVAFKTLVATERLLRTGTPEQKAGAIAKLIADYRIDPATIGAAPLPQNNNPAADPQLYNDVQQLKQSLQGMTQQQVAAQVESFAATKDTSGVPLYPHFEKVRVQMGRMIASGDERSLPELYKDAVWAVADVREALLEEQRKAAATAQTANAREAAAKARAAGSINVKSNGSDGTSKPKMPLRAEIEELARQQL